MWYWSDQEASMIVLECENGKKGTLHQKSDNDFCARYTLLMRIPSIYHYTACTTFYYMTPRRYIILYCLDRIWLSIL